MCFIDYLNIAYVAIFVLRMVKRFWSSNYKLQHFCRCYCKRCYCKRSAVTASLQLRYWTFCYCKRTVDVTADVTSVNTTPQLLPLLRDGLQYPRHELGYPGADAGEVCLSTPDAPADDSRQKVASILPFHLQGPSRVALEQRTCSCCCWKQAVVIKNTKSSKNY